MKADEILSDFSEEIIIRFFYRRKSPLPYNCTATRRFSTLLHLFYLSPFRCVKNPQGFLHEVLCFRFFCARFRRATYNCTPCATKSNTPNDFISPFSGRLKKRRPKKHSGRLILSETKEWNNQSELLRMSFFNSSLFRA